MKRWLKSIFYIPKHSKPTDENILRLLLPSVVGILICMVCLVGSTWAWFTASVSSAPQTIRTANYEVQADISPSPDEEILQSGKRYKVTLTAAGTADKFGGYCIVQIGGKSYHTAQIKTGQSLSFTIIPPSDEKVVFTPVWGSYAGEPNITEGCVIGQEEETSNPDRGTQKEPQSAGLPEDEYASTAEETETAPPTPETVPETGAAMLEEHSTEA